MVPLLSLFPNPLTHAFSITLARVFRHGPPTILRDIKAFVKKIKILQPQAPSLEPIDLGH